MNLDNKGFILPITLIISTLVILFFVTQVELLMTDRVYYHELEEKRILDNMMNLAMLDVKSKLTNNIEDTTYTESYEEGKAVVTIYRKEEILDTEMCIYQVYISCIIENGQKFSLVFLYDPTIDKIYNLVEAVVE